MTPSPDDVSGPMQPADAMWLWFATKFPTDQFIVFTFDGEPDSVADAIAHTIDRARAIAYLNVRVREDRLHLRFPRWESAPASVRQGTHHALATPTWTGCLDALGELMADQLDPRLAAWRLHVFTPVHDVPRIDGPATVVALQINHVLGDGTRTAALAGALFGRDTVPPPVARPRAVSFVRSVVSVVRARRTLARDTAAGTVPAVKGPVPPLSVNARPSGKLVVRALVRETTQLPGPTPTTGALVAISDALSGYLRARGEDATQLTAAVPVAKPGAAQAYNHYDMAFVGFHQDAGGRSQQVQRIVSDLVAWRRRSEHPSFAIEAANSVTIPAPSRRLAIRMVNTDVQPDLVPAHTTVSSVDRGNADLTFGGCPVRFTTSFPALLHISSLGHGVHTIGGTVAISVIASVPQIDLDDYLARLESALPQ